MCGARSKTDSEGASSAPRLGSVSDNASAKQHRSADRIAFDADFLKLLVGGLGFGVLMLGYAYAASFYGHLGMRTTDLGLGQLDMVFRGVALLRDWSVALIALGVIALFSLFVAGRHLLPEWAAAPAALLGFAIFIGGSIFGGDFLGAKHAKGIAEGRWGTVAFCLFHDPSGLSIAEGEAPSARLDQARLVEKLRTFGANNPLRLVHRNASYHYFAPQVDFASADRKSGEVYEVPNEIIAGCRLVSARNYG